MTAQLVERSGFTRADGGGRLHYREAGDPAGPPVVVLHGLMGHAREWDVLVGRLAPHHRVLAVDQRGHGRSDRADDYGPPALARDLTRFLEEVVGDRAVVVGHSMGGMAGLLGAARRPDLVDRLVVVDVGPDSITDDLKRMLRETLAHFAGTGYTTVDEAFSEWYDEGDGITRPELLRHYVEHCLVRRDDGRLVHRFDATGLPAFLDAVDEEQLWQAVADVSCPVLLLRGDQSPVLSPATAVEMVRRFADARLVEVSGAAHDLGVQQPEAVAEAVLRFFGSALSPRRRSPSCSPSP